MHVNFKNTHKHLIDDLFKEYLVDDLIFKHLMIFYQLSCVELIIDSYIFRELIATGFVFE